MMMATTMAVLLGNGVSMGVAKTQDQKKTQNGNGNKGMGVAKTQDQKKTQNGNGNKGMGVGD
jgi:hypothetical protein